MYKDRISLYEQLEKEFDSKILLYVTGDRQNLGAQIGEDVIDYFIEHLDKIGVTKRISLYLYTRGGDTAAAWNIVNLLRMFCDELQVIVPHKAHSAGTIISLGANEIVMTKQATLSPIDPSINTAMNPQIPEGKGTFPVSVEAVKGYLEFAQNELHIDYPQALAEIYSKLTDYVHPLVLGQTYRSRAQIQRLASKLLRNQVTEAEIKNITDFLCSDSGSHDYTINRREAENDLKLKIRKPTDKQYGVIKAIYEDVRAELQLGNSFNIERINGEYSARRALLESIAGGSDYFVSEGKVSRVALNAGPNDNRVMIHNQITFEGWRHEKTFSKVIEMASQEDQEDEYKRTGEFQL